MKFMTIIVAFASISAFAAEINPVGDYSHRHSEPVYDYNNKSECDKDAGKWNGVSDTNGFCYFPVKDTANIKKSGSDLVLSAQWFAEDDAGCSFDGKLTKVAANTYTSIQVDDYKPDGQAEFDSCAVRVELFEQLIKHTKVTRVKIGVTDGDCSFLCGNHGVVGGTLTKRTKVKKK